MAEGEKKVGRVVVELSDGTRIEATGPLVEEVAVRLLRGGWYPQGNPWWWYTQTMGTGTLTVVK